MDLSVRAWVTHQEAPPTHNLRGVVPVSRVTPRLAGTRRTASLLAGLGLTLPPQVAAPTRQLDAEPAPRPRAQFTVDALGPSRLRSSAQCASIHHPAAHRIETMCSANSDRQDFAKDSSRAGNR